MKGPHKPITTATEGRNFLCNNLIASHVIIARARACPELRHFLAQKVCSKNSLLVKDIARTQIPDVDF